MEKVSKLVLVLRNRAGRRVRDLRNLVKIVEGSLAVIVLDVYQLVLLARHGLRGEDQPASGRDRMQAIQNLHDAVALS